MPRKSTKVTRSSFPHEGEGSGDETKRQLYSQVVGDEEHTGTPVEEEEVAPESVDKETRKRRREGKRQVTR